MLGAAGGGAQPRRESLTRTLSLSLSLALSLSHGFGLLRSAEDARLLLELCGGLGLRVEG